MFNYLKIFFHHLATAGTPRLTKQFLLHNQWSPLKDGFLGKGFPGGDVEVFRRGKSVFLRFKSKPKERFLLGTKGLKKFKRIRKANGGRV